MSLIQYKTLTSTQPKKIGVPKTNQEKYDKLKQKNASLETLKNAFGLDIPL